MILRPYQEQAVLSTLKEFNDVQSTCGVLPTGCGKTIVFCEVAKRKMPGRTMILAHRQELVYQARKKIIEVTGLTCEVEMGELKAVEKGGLFSKANVVVSTIQTHTAGGDGGGRMGKFDPSEFSLLVVDEAHHAISPSYRRVIDYFCTNPELKVLGVTATPDRADEEALGQVFGSVAFDYEILDAINDGWLVPITQQFVSINGLDWANVRTLAGDLNQSDLSRVMEAEKNLHGVAGPSIEIIGGKRAIVFAASVSHASSMSEIFNRHKGGMSAWVCGATPFDERARILTDFQRGKIQVVCNCNVLTEGFDDPGVEVIVMARPTKSRALYAQMVGRSTRPLPGVVDGPVTTMGRRFAIANSQKKSCVIIDFVGNSGKHKLINTAHILGGNVSEEAVESAVAHARKAGRPVQMAQQLQQEEIWQKEAEERRIAEEARRARIVPKASYVIASIDPFDILEIKPVKSRGWDKGKVFSEKQSAMLQRNGVDPNRINYSAGRQLIKEIGKRIDAKLCSVGQMKILKKHGIDTGVKFEHAGRIIDAIAKNGWRRPAILPLPLPPEPPKQKTAQSLNEVIGETVDKIYADAEYRRIQLNEDDVPF